MNNKNIKNQLKKILNKLKLSDKELDEILMKKSEDKTIFTNKIIKVIEKYEEDPTSTLARIIGKHCKRESLNNITKRRALKRELTLNEPNKQNIKHQIQNEKRISLILDNYSVHVTIY